MSKRKFWHSLSFISVRILTITDCKINLFILSYNNKKDIFFVYYIFFANFVDKICVLC